MESEAAAEKRPLRDRAREARAEVEAKRRLIVVRESRDLVVHLVGTDSATGPGTNAAAGREDVVAVERHRRDRDRLVGEDVAVELVMRDIEREKHVPADSIADVPTESEARIE